VGSTAVDPPVVIRTENFIMSTKKRLSAAAPSRRSNPESNRRAIPLSRDRPIPPATPRILDAVRDQQGGHWIRFGTSQRAIWFAVADLIADPREVFARLSKVGAQHLTPGTQNALKRQIEERIEYREALVAARPGWLQGFYVFDDGTRASPRFDTREVIVAFESHPKFTPRGSLEDWQIAVAPFATRQPLPFFVIAFALIGPLLRFAPRGYINSQAEIVGDPETGKSSMGVLAASVWAGNPDSDCGGGESLDLTVNFLDTLKLIHGDSLLFLDEANLAGASQKDREDFAHQMVFKVAATGSRRRLGDAAQGEHTRLAMLSTTNTALADLVNGSVQVRSALQSRRITIRIAPGAPHGGFAFLPPGYESARTASEAMVAVADDCWGTVGRAFVRHLVRAAERDEAHLRQVIEDGLKSYIRQDRVPVGSARVQKSFALATVAAALAQRFGVLPKEWGSPLHLIQDVARAAASKEAPRVADPHAAILAYVEAHRAALVEVSDLAVPLSTANFEDVAGFLRRNGDDVELLVPATRFQSTFQDHAALMRRLRDAGLAQTEGGRTPKLTIKTPKAICQEGRVYCIKLGNFTS